MNKKYKVFLCNWYIAGSSGQTLLKIARGLKEKSCNILYWIGSKPPDRREFPETIFHHSKEAALAYPAEGVDVSGFEPPGRDVLEKLFECESTTLSLMDRMDYFNAPFHTRKRLYYKLARYWYGVLRSMRPDAVIFFVSPSMVHYYVLYFLAKILCIKTVICLPINKSLGSDRLLIFPDIKIDSGKFIDALRAARNTRLEDLGEDIQSYYKARVSTGENFRFPSDTERLFREEVSKRFNIRKFFLLFPKFLISLIKRTLFMQARYKLLDIFFRQSRVPALGGKVYRGIAYKKKIWEWRRLTKVFRKEYESLQIEVDWDKKFVFVALHYQPERSTCPAGGIFNDQILMINILAYSVPGDWVIYVKEHPIQWKERKNNQAHLGRYKGFYKEITSLRKVFLIPIGIMPDKLIEKCQAVATVTGTVGIEAIFKGKPALIFGYPPYKECSEIFKVGDVHSCREAIKKIVNGYRPDKQKVLDYLGALEGAGIRTWLDQPKEDKAIVEVSDEQRAKYVKDAVDAIYSEVQQ